ncbi:hypothetical protein Mgra_00000268 [Meloidogyne graminicola]|uniref:C2H2-type domain-containing protein n=1 Tax=Meloidogyne graminicola TaxID=189291 RepID=A0A8T0A559_9BILA|nr:hypothetical protein Mgra_00000268 [Meloidogyne graminicola]
MSDGTKTTETIPLLTSTLQLDCCCAYLCNLCPRTSFASMDLLDQHMREEHQQNGKNKGGDENELKNYSDEFWFFFLSKQQEIMEIEQQQQHSISPNLTCKKCPGGRIFNSREHLELHNTNTHRDRPQYCCNQCEAKFSVKRELATHLRIHSGEQPHQCEKCGKEFGTRQLLKKHYLWHNGERSHVCPVCGKSLESRMKITPSGFEPTSILCAFFQKGHLTQHLMIHKGGRPHKCSLCSKTFIFKFDLNRHLKIHSDRSFLCGRCSKCFQHEIELKGHILNCKNSSENSIRRNKRYSKRKDSLFSQNNSTNISISSSSSKEFSKISPPIFQPINKSINSHPPLPLQQQINLNRLNNLLTIYKQNPNIFSAFISSNNGGINQNSSEQLQQPIFPCFLCPQKFANQSAYLYHWTLMHLRDCNNAKTEVEEKPPPQPLVFDTFNDLSLCSSSASSLCSSSSSACSSTSTSVDFPHSTSLISEQISSSTISPLQQQQQQLNNNNVFLPQFSSFNCQNCLLEKQRLLEKERELIETRSELERIRGLFLRFGVMLGVKNETFQPSKSLTEERTTSNIGNNQILLLNKNGAAN